MKLPISWLKEFVDIDVTNPRQFMEDMTMTGSAAEVYEDLGTEISKVVVGRMVSIEKHPDADKLLITKVDIGSTTDNELQIVTGATNLSVGDYIPVALHGATLANNLKIKKGKLRGEVSDGMLCSIEELGYSKQDYPEAPEDGIYIFTEPQELGADVRPILRLLDTVVEFELLSNRPDCQSIIGLSREVAATYDKPLKMSEIILKEQAEGKAADFIEVEIKNPDLCPRYAARIVKNVTIAPSPLWLRRRLINSGLRPINNIVDITNYVMLEYGQPLHAFDIDHVADGKIVVRNAIAGEKFTTLDGVDRILDETMLVIADPEKALAIAGIMGGENSKVMGEASAVLFESACFDSTSIRLSSKKLGMSTDASAKFGRCVDGIDPNLPLAAVNRAMELIEMLGCGQVVPGVVDNYPRPRNPWTVSYKPENINKRIGIAVPNMEELLARVNIGAVDGVAKIPTFRPDIASEADICEEVARLFGYEKIPINKTQQNVIGGGKSLYQKGEYAVKRHMTAIGYSEAMTSSFEGPKLFDKLMIPPVAAVTIANPLGEDHSILRTNPLNGMISGLAINYNRRNPFARLFELTKVYIPTEEKAKLPLERLYLTMGAYDRANGMDFFTLKGDIEELFNILGITNVSFTSTTYPVMHPGRTAQVLINGKSIGHIGELHPAVAKNYEMDGLRAYIAAIELAPIIENINRDISYIPLPKFPAISRDIALQVPADIPAADIESAIIEKGGKLLTNVSLFDVYQGKQVEDGYKSMAYKLNFRHPDRTLTDEEVKSVLETILNHLQSSLGINLRG